VPTYTYRCLSCRDETVERGYNVSHIKQTCDTCGEFGRLIHDGVYQQFQEFEESPPDGLDWERLSQMEKFIVAEKMVREGKSIDDFEIESEDDSDSDTADAGTTAADAAD
jgi:hypothetical protein